MIEDAIDTAVKQRNTMTQAEELLAEIMNELDSALRKFPTWPTDPLHAKSVLGEEVGELEKAILQTVYEPHKSNKDDVKSEALQVAAMAIRFLISLDKYKYLEGDQHQQGS